MNTALILVFALSSAALAAVLGSCSKKDVPKPNADRSSTVSAPQDIALNPTFTHSPVRGREQFVGSSVCASCHRAESGAFLTSHHAQAIVPTNVQSTKSRFDGTHFTSQRGGTTTFALSADVPVVNTLNAPGIVATLKVPYVSGVWPLQQYVVDVAQGKLQALGVAWDSRSVTEGGNRWFHVYGVGGIPPDDPLFFSSAAQNWNHMCADCHSTWLERRYDPGRDTFDTQWAELSVGCEACHGPGRAHVESAQQQPPAPIKFATEFKRAEPWVPSPTGSPRPRKQDAVEVESCAPCHSLRAPLAEGFIASDVLLDHFAPELLSPGLYHADGQVEGEVYEWGSFTQSRMYQAGVRCSDCHSPHSGKLHASGDALCGRCHEPARFQAPTHSHHSGPKGPLCIDCHMPPATFMQIDERRDHSIRIPRPDHSVAFGTPNACNNCHSQQPATWARHWASKWYPSLEQRAHFVEALGKDRQGAPDAHRALRELALDVAAPPIARATALERLGNFPSPMTLETLRAAIGRSDALVVYGAVLGASQLPSEQRVPLLLPLLEHEVRAVRIAVGKAFANVPHAAVPAKARGALGRAFDEVVTSFDVSASRAVTHVERSAFELSRGRFEHAAAALQTALRLEPCLAEAHLNVAQLESQRGDEKAAERAIHAALKCRPQHAAAHHALGLWQVRAKQSGAALKNLTKAVKLAPSDVRFSYVLAVALGGGGKLDAAIGVLEASLAKHPNDMPTLQLLSRYLVEAGQIDRPNKTRLRLDALLRQ